MPAEAGIQSVLDINNFKDLDSRFRWNDGVYPITTQSRMGEGRGGGDHSLINCRKSSSVKIFTPRLFAFSCLDPGSSPTTT